MSETEQPEQQTPGEGTVYPGGFAAPPARTDVFTGYTPDPDNIESDRWPNVLLIDQGEDEDLDNRPVPVIKVETNYKPHGRVHDTYPVNLTHPETIRAAASLIYAVATGMRDLDRALPPLVLASLVSDLQAIEEAVNELREDLLADIEHGLKTAATVAAQEVAEKARGEAGAGER